jgi:hypothetical protein
MAARTYLVELVVFSHSGSPGTETWPNVHAALDPGMMSRATRPGEITPGATATPDEVAEIKQSTFKNYIKRIKRDGKRQVILETRWIQPVLDPATTQVARITDLPGDPGISNGAQAAGGRNGLSTTGTATNDLPQPVIDGFVRFYLDTQYTLEADIRYSPPYRPSILDEQPLTGPASFRINEKRKMKSGELNYYDHPKFGMVLLVTPVTSISLPEENAAGTDTTQ